MIFTDQLGNEIKLESGPQRIVSLVPSQTELLFYLGLDDRVVGITKFCIYPKEWFHSKTRIGGPKKLDIQKIIDLKPDLIIGNKEENTKEDIEKLQKTIPIWLSDVYNLSDSLQMIEGISKICGKEQNGREVVSQITQEFDKFSPFPKPLKVAYFIWKDPFMVVASNTFIHHLLTEHLGLENTFGKLERYPIVSPEDFPDLDCVFLSTEPYPFSEKHIPEFQEIFPKAKIFIVNGEYFTWYGSRLLGTPKYLTSLKKQLEIV